MLVAALRSRSCRALIIAGSLCSLWLTGCSSDPLATTSSTTTTSTTTTATTTTATTASTTTVTGPGGCLGGNVSELWAEKQWCFCFYTGRCLHHFLCHNDEDMPACQQRLCGEATLVSSSFSASFFNIADHTDILTVPRLFYVDVSDFKSRCSDGGLAGMQLLLQDGRDAFRLEGLPVPDWQCVHLHGRVGVEWLHLHTFSGTLGREHLPNVPPEAACSHVSLPLDLAAQRILAQAAVRRWFI